MQRITISFVVLLLASLALAACQDNPNEEDGDVQREVQDTIRRQEEIHRPAYSQTYATINNWLRRWDSPSKVSYVYVLADTGQILGYYASQGRPVNICTTITRPYDVLDRSEGDLLAPAPGLDGVYYSNSGCDSWYFFTADTDAYVEIGGGMKFFVTDQPLQVEAEELTIETGE